ncbi:MAG: MMPL family transporter, partial [Bradymonadaceae bacterium]
HLLNSYDRYRRRGTSPSESLVACYLSTGRSTLVGGLTTFATFVVLAFTDFRGIVQFGQISAVGILLTIVAMLTTLPALLLTLERIWQTPRPEPMDSRRGEEWMGGASAGRAGWIALAAAGAILVVWSALHVSEVEFEENFYAIGEVHWPWERLDAEDVPGRAGSVHHARRAAKTAARSVAEYAVDVRRGVAPDSFEPSRRQTSTREKYESAVGDQISSTPTVLLFEKRRAAWDGYETIAHLHRQGRLDTFESVTSIYEFVPARPEVQKKRLRQIERIERLIEESDLGGVKKKLRRRIEELRAKTDVEVVTPEDLPGWTKRFFREAGADPKPPAPGESFAYGYVVFMVRAVNTLVGRNARRVARQLDTIRREVEGEFTIASEAEAYVALLDSIRWGGVRLAAIGGAVVLLILILAFRDPVRGTIAFSSLAFAGLLLFGLIGWLGIRLDVYNIVFLTAIIGVSVDDDVHFYRRYLEMGRGQIVEAIRWVGPAVAMNTLTSAIGFGGLAFTENRGLQSIGHLAVVGVVCSLLSTLIMLPLVIKAVELLDLQAAPEERGTRPR